MFAILRVTGNEVSRQDYMRAISLALAILPLTATAIGAVGAKKQMSDHIPVRFAIHHADPWAIKAMLEGRSIVSPEQSTLWPFLGGGNASVGNQGSGNSPLLSDGFLVVNPTDNSLWWYPKSH